MPIATRPIQITDDQLSSVQTLDVKMTYAFTDISNASFYIEKLTDYNNGLVGPEIRLQTPQSTPCITFDNKQYTFESIIFTNKVDNLGTTQFSYVNTDGFSLVVKTNLNTDDTMHLYMVFPINGQLNIDDVKTPRDIASFVDAINDNMPDIENNTTYDLSGTYDLNINNLIPATDFYFYYANQDTFIVCTESPIGLKLWWLDGTITDLFDYDTPLTSIIGTDIYKFSNATYQDIIIPNSVDDIYIDCSPVSGGGNEIIKPKEVYSISPIIDPETLGNSSTMFVVLFITIIISYLSYTLGPKAIEFILSIGDKDKQLAYDSSFKETGHDILKKVLYVCAIIGIIWSSFFLTQDMLSGNIKMGGIYSSNSQLYVPMVACLLFFGGMVYKISEIRNKAIKLLSSGQGLHVADRKSLIAGSLLVVCIFVFCIIFANILSVIFISADSKPTDQTIAIFSIFITPILSFFSLDTYSKHLFPEDDQQVTQSAPQSAPQPSNQPSNQSSNQSAPL